MTAAVGLAYGVLVALAAWQVVAGRADLDVLLTFVLGALVALGVARGRVAPGRLVRWLAATSAVLSMWTIVVFLVALTVHAGDPASFYTVKLAVVTPVAAHNVLASLLLVGLVATTLAVQDDPRWWSAVLVTTLALAATLSRGAVLVGLGLPVLALLLRDRRLALQLLGPTVAALGLVLLAAGVLDASVPDAGGPTSVAARGQLWAAGWDALATHPAAGVGFDGFVDHATSLGVADPRDHAHNLLLHAGATGGVPALAAVAVLWGSLAIGGVRLPRGTARLLVLLGGGALLAHALIEETAFRPAVEVVLAVLLGLVLRRQAVAAQGEAASSTCRV